MFCPNCGVEDTNHNQFCRNCGTSLLAVRYAIERPDAVTTSAVAAREEIGSAIAAKIAEFEHADELRQSVYEILPALEKFLESPEEKRLRQRELRLVHIGEGVVTSAVGLGISLAFLLISRVTNEEKVLIVSALGLLVLLIGLGLVVSALWFTVLPERSEIPSQRIPAEIEAGDEPPHLADREGSERRPIFHSVSEGTTREL